MINLKKNDDGRFYADFKLKSSLGRERLKKIRKGFV